METQGFEAVFGITVLVEFVCYLFIYTVKLEKIVVFFLVPILQVHRATMEYLKIDRRVSNRTLIHTILKKSTKTYFFIL